MKINLNSLTVAIFSVIFLRGIANANQSAIMTCINSNNTRSITLIVEGETLEAPSKVIISGIGKNEFELTPLKERFQNKVGYIKLFGSKKIIGFRNPVKQTAYLEKQYSENGGRELILVWGIENVSYESFNCTED